MAEKDDYLKGRGAQFNTFNRFRKQEYDIVHIEGVDEPMDLGGHTQIFYEHPKKILNEVKGADLPFGWSMNPYQGCEHGCIYCYARPTHEYWGYSAGVDFERKIIVKENAPELLRNELMKDKWKPAAMMFSGNTDCYQPLERKLGITRKMLEVLRDFRNPASMITKNSLILRDLDILKEMASMNLVHVSISITTLDNDLRLALEPRTATAAQRLKTVEVLSANGIPVNVMIAPIIPGLNHHEIPEIMKAAAERGAVSAGYTIVRLNGSLQPLFEDWLQKNFPDRAEKVLNHIRACHGGQLNDSRSGTRMRGEGQMALSIRDLFRLSRLKYLKGRSLPDFDLSLFRRPGKVEQLGLF
jgi:DNA repair photolyase